MFDFFRRLFASTAIRIESGKAQCIKGSLRSQVLSDITDICQTKGVTSGEVWISSAGRITFSKAIPDSAHQRIRNIVASR